MIFIYLLIAEPFRDNTHHEYHEREQRSTTAASAAGLDMYHCGEMSRRSLSGVQLKHLFDRINQV